MSDADFGQLLAGAREMQAKLEALQGELARRRIEGSAGGGMVRVVVDGQLRVHELQIDPKMLETGDREMLQDLCIAAVNAALTSAQRTAQEELQRATGPSCDRRVVGNPMALMSSTCSTSQVPRRCSCPMLAAAPCGDSKSPTAVFTRCTPKARTASTSRPRRRR